MVVFSYRAPHLASAAGCLVFGAFYKMPIFHGCAGIMIDDGVGPVAGCCVGWVGCNVIGLHSVPMDMRERWVKPGKTCAVFASCGSWGRDSSQASLVELKNAPLGRPT